MMHGRQWILGVAMAALTVTFAGCFGSGGDKATYKTTGKVKFADGSPLTRGQVIFQSQQNKATGDLKEDGTFSLGTFKAGDGAPAGKYRVYFSGANAPAPTDANGNPGYGGGKPLLAPKYYAPETSGLEYEVKSGSNNFEIPVEKAP